MSLADGFGEHNLEDVVSVLVRIVEAAGAAVIFVGAGIAVARFVLIAFRREGMAPFARLRLGLGRFLVLGLEFQLAADILRTAVAPNFTELAQLGAVAGIRTAPPPPAGAPRQAAVISTVSRDAALIVTAAGLIVAAVAVARTRRARLAV